MTAIASVTGMDRHSGRALTGTDHLRQSIIDILTTPIGTRLCQRDYGSQLPDLIDAPMNDAGVQALFAATASAIATWYPWLVLTQIALAVGDEPGSLTMTLTGHESGRADSPFSLPLALPFTAPAFATDTLT